MKEKINLRSLIDKHQGNCDRIGEIADTCERENRALTAEEKAEVEGLERENSLLRMKMSAAQAGVAQPKAVNADTELREAMKAGRKFTVMLTREVQTTAALEGTGIIPVDQQEMLKPLRAGLIWDKVGINVQSGLVGTLRWPKHTKAVASWADEAARLVDSSIDFSKLEMSGTRMGIAVPLTREELNDSEGIVERIVREEMPAACIDLINDALFTTKGTYQSGDNTVTKKVVGPFVDAAVNNLVEFAGEVPTRKELLKMKTKVAKAGIKFVAPCWVMTEDMKAELEDTKVDAGSGRFVCENGMILGYPVFTTPAIGEGNIGFGDWSYQAAGFFGSMDLIVDPYTLARNNATDFVLNGRFGTVTLRPEAFVLGHEKTKVASGQ